MAGVPLAITLLLLAAFLVLLHLRYRAGLSERRMKRMMIHYGLDPEIADGQTIITEVRRRCRKCQFDAHCERWLAGKEAGNGSFCPNARVFQELTRPGHA